MRVAVIGAGVIGIATAWFLARAGHKVTVIERRDGAADETSYGNAGLLSPGHAQSWASPKAPMLLLRSLVDKDVAVRLHLKTLLTEPRLWGWGLRFLANCTERKAAANTTLKMALIHDSLDAMASVLAEADIAFSHRTGGILYLHRDAASLDAAEATYRGWAAHGLTAKRLDEVACLALDPGLAPLKGKLAGAILCEEDQSGDCAAFTRGLAERCAAAGVEFRYGTSVTGLTVEGGRIARVDTADGPVGADGFVLAAGSFSPVLARGIGLKLPIYPLKGYSLTLPARNAAPAYSAVDEEGQIAWSRFGDRLRVTSYAELAGLDQGIDPARIAALVAKARGILPDAADWDRPGGWAGLRPMTPDGQPLVGPTRFENLWLNTGHGSLGWSMGCGAGRRVAGMIGPA
jgi:D-amino-acid dehydrogenase